MSATINEISTAACGAYATLCYFAVDFTFTSVINSILVD